MSEARILKNSSVLESCDFSMWTITCEIDINFDLIRIPNREYDVLLVPYDSVFRECKSGGGGDTHLVTVG